MVTADVTAAVAGAGHVVAAPVAVTGEENTVAIVGAEAFAGAATEGTKKRKKSVVPPSSKKKKKSSAGSTATIASAGGKKKSAVKKSAAPPSSKKKAMKSSVGATATVGSSKKKKISGRKAVQSSIGATAAVGSTGGKKKKAVKSTDEQIIKIDDNLAAAYWPGFVIFLKEESDLSDFFASLGEIYEDSPRPVLLKDKFGVWLESKKLFRGCLPVPESVVEMNIPLVSSRSKTTAVPFFIDILREDGVYHSMKSSLSDSEIDDIFNIEIWKRALDKQRMHVDCCLCQKSTQLLARNQKLLLLDLDYFKIFSKEFERFVPLCLSTKRRRYLKACAYELCHQYFYISRKIDYLPCNVTL